MVEGQLPASAGVLEEDGKVTEAEVLTEAEWRHLSEVSSLGIMEARLHDTAMRRDSTTDIGWLFRGTFRFCSCGTVPRQGVETCH